jgi:hypothetical protein
MKTITLRAEIDDRGRIALDIESGLPPGPAEVVVVVQQLPASQPASGHRPRARSGLFLDEPSREVDVDAAVDEMNAEWKVKLGDFAL